MPGHCLRVKKCSRTVFIATDMEIPEKKVIELQELYKKQFGKEISHEQAYGLGDALIRIIRLVYDPFYGKNNN